MASVHLAHSRSTSTASLSMSRSLSHSRHSTTEPTAHPKSASDLFSPLLSLSFNSTVTKAVRAYEVDRQRSKNKREYELAQERKEQAALEKEKAKNTCGRRSIKDIWEQGQNAATATRNDVKALSKPAKSISQNGSEEGALRQHKREVTLEDLIKPGGHGGSRRKGRKGKGETLCYAPRSTVLTPIHRRGFRGHPTYPCRYRAG